MTPATIERRRTPRRQSAADHGIEWARVRPGIKVEIVDVSAGGVLIEARHRLMPGMPTEIHFQRHQRTSTVRGRVLRCSVVRVDASSVSYRGAIGFDGPISWFGDDSSGSAFSTSNTQ